LARPDTFKLATLLYRIAREIELAPNEIAINAPTLLAQLLKKYRCAHPPCPVLVVEDDADLRKLVFPAGLSAVTALMMRSAAFGIGGKSRMSAFGTKRKSANRLVRSASG
jgi:hypothetical protein